MRRQCFSTLRDRAIFSFSLVHTGDVSCSFARSCFTCIDKCRFMQAFIRCNEGLGHINCSQKSRPRVRHEAYRNDTGASTHGANVEHEHLVFHELAHFALLLPTLHMRHSR